jgi:hypothetical protein
MNTQRQWEIAETLVDKLKIELGPSQISVLRNICLTIVVVSPGLPKPNRFAITGLSGTIRPEKGFRFSDEAMTVIRHAMDTYQVNFLESEWEYLIKAVEEKVRANMAF